MEDRLSDRAEGPPRDWVLRHADDEGLLLRVIGEEATFVLSQRQMEEQQAKEDDREPRW